MPVSIQIISGFCKASKTNGEIQQHENVLTVGRYVGATEVDEDGVPFGERFAKLKEELERHFSEARELETAITKRLARIGK